MSNNCDTHGEVMSDISVKQGCPLSPIIFGSYNDELETYLDETDMDPMCLFNEVVGIHLHADNVVMLSKLGASLQRLMNKLNEFSLSIALKSIYLRLKS